MKRTEYIETLIKLIELNEDHYWIDCFLNLRKDGYLPTGGAGALNDWGPHYKDKTEQSWFNLLYDLLKYLFLNNLSINHAEKILIKWNKNYLIRCSKCNSHYQHPSIFERQIALKYYKENLVRFVKNNTLETILESSNSYDNIKTNNYRKSILKLYELNGIKIYDFVANNYICPTCKTQNAETFHDKYEIKLGFYEQLKLKIV